MRIEGTPLYLQTAADIRNIDQSRDSIAASMAGNDGLLLFGGNPGGFAHSLPREQQAFEEVWHGENLTQLNDELENAIVIYRHEGRNGNLDHHSPGLLDIAGGSTMYTGLAKQLVSSGAILASRISDERQHSIASPWLSAAMISPLDADYGGASVLLRQTEADIEAQTSPIPTFIMRGSDGDLESTYNSIDVLTSEKTLVRPRLSLQGLGEIPTFANPNVGIVLSGNQFMSKTEDVEAVVEEMFEETRKGLDKRFGEGQIPILIDIGNRFAGVSEGCGVGIRRMAKAVLNLSNKTEIAIDGIFVPTQPHEGEQQEFGNIPGVSTQGYCISEKSAVEIYRDFDAMAGDEIYHRET